MKTILFASLLSLMACGTDEKETSVVQGTPVALLLCSGVCIPDDVSNGTFSLTVPGVCRGTVSQPQSCCEYTDLPKYRECQKK